MTKKQIKTKWGDKLIDLKSKVVDTGYPVGMRLEMSDAIQIVSQFVEDLAAMEEYASGPRWVKASERLPDKNKWVVVKQGGELWELAQFNGLGFDAYEKGFMELCDDDDLEWLDETPAESPVSEPVTQDKPVGSGEVGDAVELATVRTKIEEWMNQASTPEWLCEEMSQLFKGR